MGGDNSVVQDQLRGVQQIQATISAFAAILEDGSVVTWGPCRLWRRQFGSSRSAQRCSANSSHRSCLCCDSGRWIRRYLGWAGTTAATVRQFKVSSRVCSRYRPLVMGPLLRFCKMDLSLLGALRAGAVTVRQFKISSGVCSKFNPLLLPVLRFWKMDPSLPGVGGTTAATVRQFKVSSRVCSRYRPLVMGAFAAILQDGSVVTWGVAGWCGDSSAVQDQLRGVQQIQSTVTACAALLEDGSIVTWGGKDHGGDSSADSRSAQGCAANSIHCYCLCCASGRWIHCYLGWERPWW